MEQNTHFKTRVPCHSRPEQRNHSLPMSLITRVVRRAPSLCGMSSLPAVAPLQPLSNSGPNRPRADEQLSKLIIRRQSGMRQLCPMPEAFPPRAKPLRNFCFGEHTGEHAIELNRYILFV